MKRNIIKLLMAQLMLLCAISANALEFSVDGIRYKTNGNEASVTSGGTYSGNVIIPSTVTYNGVTYSVTSIGGYAFYNCTGLTKITIPESVTSICKAAFHGCTGLSSVNIVDIAAWCRISFEYYDISYSYDTSNPLRYAHHLYLNGSEVINLVIPESVTFISSYAFYGCTEFTSVTIPESVTSIRSSAFYGCTGLTSVTIGNSVTSIGIDAFRDCKALTSITVPESVNAIGIRAFYGCTALKTLNYNAVSCSDFNNEYYGEFPFKGLNISTINIGNSVQRIPSNLAYDLKYLTRITIPESVTSIGGSAFYGCTGLSRVDVGSSVTSIGGSAFYGCSSLTSVNITDIAAWCRIDFSSEASNPLYQAQHLYLNGSEVINLVIPESVTSIGRFAFYRCTGLTSITIPESVTSIGGSAFYSCTGLMSVTIPESVTSIGGSAFYGCTGLSRVDIGNSVTSIGGSAFYGCTGLTCITIPESVNTIDFSAFRGCTALETLNFDAVSCTVFYSVYPDDLPFGGLNISTINIGNRVQIIPERFAYGLDKLTSITIPESVTSIGDYAFWGCAALETLNYNATSCAYFDVNWGPFRGLNISTINIGNSVQRIPSNFARGLSKLTSITIPESVTSIGNGAFSYCTGLTSITIPESVTSIGGSAFDGCTSMTRVNITDIEAWCRIDFSSNTSNPLYLAHHLYLNGSEVINLVIPNSITTIGDYTFDGCMSLISVTFLSSVTSIGAYAFAGCNNILFVKLPKTLKSIGEYTFYNCSGLPSITIPESVTSIGNYAFSGCTGLFSVTIPNSVTTIGNYSFSGCSGLTSATINSHLTSIGSYAFSNCSALSSFTCMPKTPPVLDNSNSFSTYGFTSLYVPRSGVENYKTHTNWRRFSKIYEFVGYFTVPDVNVSKGKTVVIPVSMTNEADIIGFQTDIYLPEGFEFVKDGNDYVVDPSDRMARDHAIVCNVSEDGALRVLCYSPTNKVISGNEGELFYVTIKAPNDTVGDFSLWFKNTILTTSDSEELLSPNASTNLNVIPYLPGDANGNGEVSVIDIVTAAQYIIFQNPDPFHFEAADLNNDEQITVTDLALIANLILYPTKNAPKRVPSIDISEDQIHGNDIYLNVGETRTVNITLDNSEKYSAFQMDLKLPDGLTASNFKMTNQSGCHSFITSEEKDGMIRIMCYSPSLTSLGHDDKPLLAFDVTSIGNIVGDIIIDGIEIVTTTCNPVHLDALTISVNQTNTINEISNGKSAAHIDYYNLAGHKQAEPAKGVTIIVTTYSDGSRSSQKVIL